MIITIECLTSSSVISEFRSKLVKVLVTLSLVMILPTKVSFYWNINRERKMMMMK